MPIDQEMLTEIKAYMDERAETWKHETASNAQKAAREEVKAADDRIAKRNTVFGIGVGAVLLSVAGFAYQSITGTVSGIAKTAEADAKQVAKKETESILASDQRVISFQKESMKAIVEAQTATSVALNQAKSALDDADELLKEARSRLEGISETGERIESQITNADNQVQNLREVQESVDGERYRLETTLNEAAAARERLVLQSESVEKAIDLSERLLGASGQIEDIVLAALNDNQIREGIISAAAFPKGAVVAFTDQKELSAVCPDDWSFYSQSQGKFIIGASEFYPPGSVGGEVAVTLSAPEMPIHTHEIGRDNGEPLRTRTYNYQVGGSPVNLLHLNGNQDIPAAALRAGGSKPHNNMPPNLTVYFCKKD